MQRGHGSRRKIFEERKMDQVDVKMQNIECMPAQMKLMQHGQVSGQVRFQRARIEPDGLIAYRDQPRPCVCLRAREQRDLVPELDESVGQVRDDAFSAAIQARRHRLIQGRDLSDLHKMPSINPVVSRLTRIGSFAAKHFLQTAARLQLPRSIMAGPIMWSCRPDPDRTAVPRQGS